MPEPGHSRLAVGAAAPGQRAADPGHSVRPFFISVVLPAPQALPYHLLLVLDGGLRRTYLVYITMYILN